MIADEQSQVDAASRKDHNTSSPSYQYNKDGESDEVLNPAKRSIDGDLLSLSVVYGHREHYLHTRKNPKYLDTLKKPYARFVFKYRAPGE